MAKRLQWFESVAFTPSIDVYTTNNLGEVKYSKFYFIHRCDAGQSHGIREQQRDLNFVLVGIPVTSLVANEDAMTTVRAFRGS